MNLFIFGLGYAGLAIARQAILNEWQVTATVRSTGKALKLADFGGRVIALDHPQAYRQIVEGFKSATHVLSTVPPEGDDDPITRDYGQIMQAARQLEWAGYISATSVYGDTGGAWVDETAALKPLGARGAARVAAERAWMAQGHAASLPTHVFRVAGIYGTRASVLDQLRAGAARRIDKRLTDGTPHVMNRIHVDDLAGAVMASMGSPDSARHGAAIYNIADDLPSPSAEVVAYAAGLLNLPIPPLEPFDETTLSPMQASFYAECKRVDNKKMKERLGYSLRYTTYREGLASLV